MLLAITSQTQYADKYTFFFYLVQGWQTQHPTLHPTIHPKIFYICRYFPLFSIFYIYIYKGVQGVGYVGLYRNCKHRKKKYANFYFPFFCGEFFFGYTPATPAPKKHFIRIWCHKPKIKDLSEFRLGVGCQHPIYKNCNS